MNDSARPWIIALASLGLIGFLPAATYIFGLLLGVNLGELRPWYFALYAIHYGHLENISDRLWLAGLLAAALAFGPAVAVAILTSQRALYGAARFASLGEIKRYGLLSKRGLLVGKLGARRLCLGGSQHVLMAAPTRSGKGVGIVIPNLLTWPDSTVVLDIKQENWAITAGWREQQGQNVYLFNPLDVRTHRYNPFGYVREDHAGRIDDLQRLAAMIAPDPPGSDPIWSGSARSLFVGLGLYLFETAEETGEPVTMGAMYRLAKQHGNLVNFLDEEVNKRASGPGALSDVCRGELSTWVATPDRTRGGVLATLVSRLELWAIPVVDAATSSNDFDLRELRRRRMSIYVGITPDNLERVAFLINLFFQQLIDLNTRELPEADPTLKHKVMLMMDEFTSIGRLDILLKGIAYIAGYGLRLLPIIQTPAQLRDTYGIDAAETFMQNCALHVIFAPKDGKTAEDISRTLGDQTVRQASVSRPRLFGRSSGSVSQHEARRALLLPQEVRQIGDDRAILIYEGARPILCHKIRYFKERFFTRRARLPGPTVPPLAMTRAAPAMPAADQAAATPASINEDALADKVAARILSRLGQDQASPSPADSTSLGEAAAPGVPPGEADESPESWAERDALNFAEWEVDLQSLPNATEVNWNDTDEARDALESLLDAFEPRTARTRAA